MKAQGVGNELSHKLPLPDPPCFHNPDQLECKCLYRLQSALPYDGQSSLPAG